MPPEEAKRLSPTMLTPEQQALQDPGFFSPAPPLSGLAGVGAARLGMKMSQEIEKKLIQKAAPTGIPQWAARQRPDITQAIGPTVRVAEDLNAAGMAVAMGNREEALVKLVEASNDLGTLLRMGEKSPVPVEQLSAFIDARNQLGRLLQGGMGGRNTTDIPWFEIPKSR